MDRRCNWCTDGDRGVGLGRPDLDALGSDELWQKAEASVRQIVSAGWTRPGSWVPHLDRDELIEDVLNEALGLSPLETWLADDSSARSW